MTSEHQQQSAPTESFRRNAAIDILCFMYIKLFLFLLLLQNITVYSTHTHTFIFSNEMLILCMHRACVCTDFDCIFFSPFPSPLSLFTPLPIPITFCFISYKIYDIYLVSIGFVVAHVPILIFNPIEYCGDMLDWENISHWPYAQVTKLGFYSYFPHFPLHTFVFVHLYCWFWHKIKPNKSSQT